jgi:hypothetical protein
VSLHCNINKYLNYFFEKTIKRKRMGTTNNINLIVVKKSLIFIIFLSVILSELLILFLKNTIIPIIIKIIIKPIKLNI